MRFFLKIFYLCMCSYTMGQVTSLYNYPTLFDYSETKLFYNLSKLHNGITIKSNELESKIVQKDKIKYLRIDTYFTKDGIYTFNLHSDEIKIDGAYFYQEELNSYTAKFSPKLGTISFTVAVREGIGSIELILEEYDIENKLSTLNFRIVENQKTAFQLSDKKYIKKKQERILKL